MTPAFTDLALGLSVWAVWLTGFVCGMRAGRQ